MRSTKLLRCGCLALFCAASAAPRTIDFEGQADGTLITTQYSGLVFSNTQILTSGISLNEFEFPPFSGGNVASDASGPITVTFASPVVSVSGRFTYLTPLTLQAFTGSQLVASVTSAFSNNEALSGDAGSNPNELLSVAFGSGISRLVISGSTSGGSFTLDDLTTQVQAVSPEPDGLSLLGLAGFIVLIWRRHWPSPHRS